MEKSKCYGLYNQTTTSKLLEQKKWEKSFLNLIFELCIFPSKLARIFSVFIYLSLQIHLFDKKNNNHR